MAEHWCKVSCELDSHPKICRAGRLGREVFLFALRRNSLPSNKTPGRVNARELEPWYIAAQLMMPEAEAVTGVTAELLLRDEAAFVIVGWTDDWGKPRDSTAAERKARQRAKQRNDSTSESESVTTKKSRRDVTAGHIDQRREEEIRVEEIRSENAPARETSAPPRPPKKARSMRSGLSSDWSPSRETRAKAVELGVDCDREAEQFRDFHTAKGSLFIDWEAAFRTWLRNAQKFAARGGSSPRRQGAWTVEDQLERVRMLEEQERAEGRTA